MSPGCLGLRMVLVTNEVNFGFGHLANSEDNQHRYLIIWDGILRKNRCSFGFCPNYLFCYLVLFQAVHHGIWFFRTRLQENYTSIVLRCLVVCYCFFSMKSNTCRIAATALDLWRTSLASGLASSHGKRELSGRRTNTPCLLPRVVGGKRVLSAETSQPRVHPVLTSRWQGGQAHQHTEETGQWVAGTQRQTQTDIQYVTRHEICQKKLHNQIFGPEILHTKSA